MLALLAARSGIVDLGNEALPHVNDLLVHLIACVHALGHEPELRFIQLPHQALCQDTGLVLWASCFIFS